MGTISPEVVGAIAAAVALVVSALINAFISKMSQRTKGKAESADAAESLSTAASTLVEAYRQEVVRLQTEMKQMQATLGKATVMAEDVARLQQDRLACMRREAEMSGQIDSLNKALTAAEARIATLESERRAATQGSQVRDQEIAHLRGQVDLLTGQIVSLTKQLEAVTQERDDLRRQIAFLTSQLNDLKVGVQNGFTGGHGEKGDTSS